MPSPNQWMPTTRTSSSTTGPGYPGAAELSLAPAQWVAFYSRNHPRSYCHDLTPDHAEQLHYDRTRILNPEEAFTQ